MCWRVGALAMLVLSAIAIVYFESIADIRFRNCIASDGLDSYSWRRLAELAYQAMFDVRSQDFLPTLGLFLLLRLPHAVVLFLCRSTWTMAVTLLAAFAWPMLLAHAITLDRTLGCEFNGGQSFALIAELLLLTPAMAILAVGILVLRSQSQGPG